MLSVGKYRPPAFVESFFGSEKIDQVLDTAPLRIADFHATSSFLQENSVCVFLHDEPFILLGYAECESSKAVAERLVNSTDLVHAINYFLGINGYKLTESVVLQQGTILNSDLKEHFYYNMALIPNPKVPESEHGLIPGDIQALFHPTCLPITVMQQIVFYITAHDALTKCFSPHAKTFQSFELKRLPSLD
ncbi:hypothetical protein MUB04_15580 [Acinetobacter indicus]|uniref:hypothetical protein n=1 Tax=Acinetobacter TaxID=469 RepID=UPI0015D45A56|nr:MULTISPECIES: hypothetical protein [Acinetobacter]MCP0917958.1 hypothetical protein [Acinetobacter indicus]